MAEPVSPKTEAQALRERIAILQAALRKCQDERLKLERSLEQVRALVIESLD